MISTIAGTGVGIGPAGVVATAAGLSLPRDVAFDASGNFYISDAGDAQRVWRVDADTDVITIVAGTSAPGGFNGDARLATGSRLSNPSGLAVGGASGDLYIADTFNYRIRRVGDLQGLVADDDGDGDNDDADNCPDTANPDQSNFDMDDMDGLGDLCDDCETIANLGEDNDVDGVDNACDTCLNQWNPPLAGAPAQGSNRTLVSHQRDDDADGRGNRCDFDYNNAGATVTATDFNDMKASVGKLMTASNCGAVAPGGSGNAQRCGEFDHDGLGAVVGVTDFNLCKSALGRVINTDFPKCSACSAGTGWSDVLGPGARLGRPVCQMGVGGACTYAP